MGCLQLSVLSLLVYMMMTLPSVIGDCDLSSSPRCDLMYPKVVSKLTYNGTCAQKAIAQLQAGNTYAFNFTFTPVADAQNAISVVVVQFPFGIMIPGIVSQPDACEGSEGLKCPLKANTTYNLQTLFVLPPVLPISLPQAVVIWTLVDHIMNEDGTTRNKQIFCVRVKSVIKQQELSEEEEEDAFAVIEQDLLQPLQSSSEDVSDSEQEKRQSSETLKDVPEKYSDKREFLDNTVDDPALDSGFLPKFRVVP